jgi:hypothetical protein
MGGGRGGGWGAEKREVALLELSHYHFKSVFSSPKDDKPWQLTVSRYRQKEAKPTLHQIVHFRIIEGMKLCIFSIGLISCGL